MTLKKTLSLFALYCVALIATAGYIPLEPGTVAVRSELLWRWEFASDSKDGEVLPRGSLRYYGKSGTGSFTAVRNMNIDCSGYDLLIYEAYAYYSLDPALKISGYIETDAGRRQVLEPETVKANGKTYISPSIRFDIKGVKKVTKFVLTAKMTKPGVARAQFPRGIILLQNSAEHASYMKHFERYAGIMDEFMQPPNYQPKFKLQYEIFFSNRQLDDFRKYNNLKPTKANLDNIPSPVGLITDNLGGARDQMMKKFLETVGEVDSSALRFNTCTYAMRSLIFKDKGLMRVAARYMLAMAACGDWADCGFKPMGGNSSCAFSASWNAVLLVLALDCAGEMLNARGKNYVLRALLFNGVANITYSLWGRSYAMKMNQGISFLRGKIAALAVFNKVWPGVMPTIEITKDDADRCVNSLFTKNGGYLESKGYLDYTVQGCSLPFYQIYSRIVNKPLLEVVPVSMRNSGNYAEVLASTCQRPGWDMITLGGQAHSCRTLSAQGSAFLAAVTPGSMWVNLYHKVDPNVKKRALSHIGLFTCISKELFDLADKAPLLKKFRNFIQLKDNALVASLRDFKGKQVKIVMVGDNDGIGKKNSDAGSFVLEFAGDAFAMQMPVYNGIYFEPQYRNMLIPTIAGNTRYANQLNLLQLKNRSPMVPVASGNATSFKAKTDNSNAWDKKYFTQSSIAIDSPTPDTVKVSCNYTAGTRANGGALMWLTYLPVEIKGDKALITGNYGGIAELSAPGCTIKVEKFTPSVAILRGMSMDPKAQCSRIIISKNTAAGKKDSIVVNCKLSTK